MGKEINKGWKANPFCFFVDLVKGKGRAFNDVVHLNQDINSFLYTFTKSVMIQRVKRSILEFCTDVSQCK